MKKISLQSLIEKIQQVALRFPFTLFFVLGFAFYFFLEINKKHIVIHPSSWAFFSLGIALSLAVTLLLENYKKTYVKIGLNLLSIILLYIYTFTLPDKFLPVHNYQLASLGFVFVLAAFFVSFLKKNVDVAFWEFSKTTILQLIISSVFAVVLMLGLSLAVLSLKELFNIDVKDEVYQNLAVICFVIFAPIYFLANVPDSTEKLLQEYSFPKFLKILGLYILLPILAIYSLILYVYLSQIIIKWELPNGWVSTLVSILGLGGFLCMLILYPLRLEGENKVVNLFSKYFPLLLLPLLVLMSVGIFRRLGDYGLTINRCYVLILNVWLFGISFYLFLSKSKHLKWIIISFALVLFLSSVGSWSVFSITRYSLTNKLEKLFTEANVLKDGKITADTMTLKIDSTRQSTLIETIKYLHTNYGNESLQPYFSYSLDNKSVAKILASLNLKDKETTDEMQYVTALLPSGLLINIDDYQYVLDISISENKASIYKDDNLTVTLDKNQIKLIKSKSNEQLILIPLEPKMKQLLNESQKNGNKEFTQSEMTMEGTNYKLVIYSISAQYDEMANKYKINNCDAHLYYKTLLLSPHPITQINVQVFGL